MKICKKCNLAKQDGEFNWKIKGVRLSTYCRKCSREYVRNHYLSNKKYYLEKSKRRNIKLRLKTIEYLAQYLKSHPCVDCGETDILVLEFDHISKTNKTEEVNKIVSSRSSLLKVMNEIEKCQVRCANCHRRKTAKETNSWRLDHLHP